MEGQKKILLVEVPPWDPRTPPLGIAYLASYLKQRGMEASIFDLNIEMHNCLGEDAPRGWGNEDFHWWQSSHLEESYAAKLAPFVDRILDYDIRILGFSVTLPSINFLTLILKILKKRAPDRIVIVGGPATFFPEMRQYEFREKEAIDYFVVGDGEETLYHLIANLKNNGSLDPKVQRECKVWKDSPGDKTLCLSRPKIMDLDSLPSPTFEGFDLAAYVNGSTRKDFTLPVIFSKGCTRACTFCSDRVLSNPYRCRKPEKVVSEIKSLVSRYGNRHFRLNDLSLNANLEFLDEFCDRVISEGLYIRWHGQAQVRPEMTGELLKKLRKAGCIQFSLGMESFSDHVLTLMRKGYKANDAVEFLKKTKDAGISTHIAVIVGYPGETQRDFEETLEQIRKNSLYIDAICSLNICGMPIGSEIRNDPEKYGYHLAKGVDWVTKDGTNDYAVRKKRYNDVAKCGIELGIQVDACLDLNVFEETLGDK